VCDAGNRRQAARTGRAALCLFSRGFSPEWSANQKSRVAVLNSTTSAREENRAATPAGLPNELRFFARAPMRCPITCHVACCPTSPHLILGERHGYDHLGASLTGGIARDGTRTVPSSRGRHLPAGHSWYPVTACAFIWMVTWCPQWFWASGKYPQILFTRLEQDPPRI